MTFKKFISMGLVLMLFAVTYAFGQSPPADVPATETVVDTTVLTSAALGIAGIVSSVFLTYIRNKFELSSTLTYFLYLGLSAAIAAGVVFYQSGFSKDNLGQTLAIVFIVGQAVYQSLIKGTSFGEIGNSGKPPSEVNESSVLKGDRDPDEL